MESPGGAWWERTRGRTRRRQAKEQGSGARLACVARSSPFGRHRRREPGDVPARRRHATLIFVVAIVVGGVVVAIVVGGVVVGLLVGLVLSRPRTCPRGLRTFCRSRPNANLANLAPMGSAPWDHPVPKAPPSPLMVRNLWLPALADAVKGAESTVGGGRRRRHRRNRNGGNFSEIKNRTAPRLFKLAQSVQTRQS